MITTRILSPSCCGGSYPSNIRFSGNSVSRTTSPSTLTTVSKCVKWVLEMMVTQNLDRGDLPDSYQLLVVETPDEMAFAAVAESDLPTNWRRSREATRVIGDAWLASSETPLLRVPSAIVPSAVNWLLNPAHGDARQAAVAEIIRADRDARLSGRG